MVERGCELVLDDTPGDPSDDETVVSPEHHFQYDGFGNSVGAASPAAADFLFAFTGRPFDADTGLQWNLNRWYDPAVGRWLSEDPIGFSAGDANLYRYVGNQATGAIDRDGLEEEGWFRYLAGSVAGNARDVVLYGPFATSVQFWRGVRSRAEAAWKGTKVFGEHYGETLVQLEEGEYKQAYKRELAFQTGYQLGSSYGNMNPAVGLMRFGDRMSAGPRWLFGLAGVDVPTLEDRAVELVRGLDEDAYDHGRGAAPFGDAVVDLSAAGITVGATALKPPLRCVRVAGANRELQ